MTSSPLIQPPEPNRPARTRGRLGRLILKESREILRDRRTIITLVLMPLLLYPLLSLGFQRFLLAGYGASARQVYRIGATSHREAQVLQFCLDWGNQELASRRRRPPAEDEAKAEMRFLVQDLAVAVRDYSIDLGVRVRNPEALNQRADQNFELDCELVYLEGSSYGERAREYFEERMRAFNERYLRGKLQAAGISQRVEPVQTTEAPLVDPEHSGGLSVAAFIPVILILMTITGAVYPAIDLTAGERERGTLEMLIAAPVPRLSLLFAKYVAVLVVAFLTAAVNLISMTVTLSASGLGSRIWGDQGLSLLTVFEVLGLLVLFASFFSAVLLTLTSFARSFKEAQAYLIPLMLFSISPGLIGLIPGLKLSGWLLVAPLLNIALLSRDLLQGQAEPAAAVIVVLSTVLFAVAAIGVAARIFGTDAVLYEAQATWSDLWRRSVKGSAVPSLPGAMLCLAFLFPAFFLLSNSVALLAGENLPLRLAALSAATAVVFALLPGLAAWWGRVRFDTAFRFQTPPWLSLPAAVLLGLSLWPFAHELTLLTRAIGLVTFDEAQLARVQGLLEKLRTVSPAVILFALAAVPACFEELFFRGYLFSALSARLRPRMAILSSALAFGVFHLIAMDSLALERFAPSALMGVALGWVAWRTASVYPGMLVHFCHNGFLMLVAYYKVELAAWGWGVGENEHLPLAWQAAAILGCGVAVALLQISSRKRAGAASPQNFVG